MTLFIRGFVASAVAFLIFSAAARAANDPDELMACKVAVLKSGSGDAEVRLQRNLRPPERLPLWGADRVRPLGSLRRTAQLCCRSSHHRDWTLCDRIAEDTLGAAG